MAWYRTHDESTQGQRDSRNVQPSRRQHPKPTMVSKETTPQKQKQTKKQETWNNDKLPSQTKQPLTMEVRCTPLRCVRAAAESVWRDSLLIMLDWLGTLLDGQHAQGGPPLSPCDSCHACQCPMPIAHRPLSFVLTDSSVTPHPRVLVLCCTTPHFPVSSLLPCA